MKQTCCGVVAVVALAWASLWPLPSHADGPKREPAFQEGRPANQLETNSTLLSNFRHRLREVLWKNGHSADAGDALQEAYSLPPSEQYAMPSIGTVRVPVLLIEFPDYPHGAVTADKIRELFFGEGGNTYLFPFDSLRKFYLTSSFNKLNVQGDVYGWYMAAHPRAYYESLTYTEHELAAEAISYYHGLGYDFSQYDSDNNGFIDAVYIEWSGAGSVMPWVPHEYATSGFPFTVDGKRINGISFCAAGEDPTTKWVYAEIHESGHLMGIPDYYDYDASVGPKGGVGATDVLGGGNADHNALTKFLLGWTTPELVTTDQSRFITLSPRGDSGASVLMMPGASLSNTFSEFFLIEYMKVGHGNDYIPPGYSDPTLGNGLMVWHVDARLNDAGRDFRFDNSYTEHKLLRLMEADGLEQIETGAVADVNDYWNAPKEFGPTTLPSSNNYAGDITGVWIDQISKTSTSITARFSVGERTAIPPTPTATPTPTPTPHLTQTKLSATLSPTSVKVRRPFVYTTILRTRAGAALSSRVLRMEKSTNRTSWQSLFQGRTNRQGKLSRTFASLIPGTFYLRTSFIADARYAGSRSSVLRLRVSR